MLIYNFILRLTSVKLYFFFFILDKQAAFLKLILCLIKQSSHSRQRPCKGGGIYLLKWKKKSYLCIRGPKCIQFQNSLSLLLFRIRTWSKRNELSIYLTLHYSLITSPLQSNSLRWAAGGHSWSCHWRWLYFWVFWLKKNQKMFYIRI